MPRGVDTLAVALIQHLATETLPDVFVFDFVGVFGGDDDGKGEERV